MESVKNTVVAADSRMMSRTENVEIILIIHFRFICQVSPPQTLTKSVVVGGRKRLYAQSKQPFKNKKKKT